MDTNPKRIPVRDLIPILIDSYMPTPINSLIGKLSELEQRALDNGAIGPVLIEMNKDYCYDSCDIEFYLSYSRLETPDEVSKRLEAAQKQAAKRKADRENQKKFNEAKERELLAKLQKKYGEGS